MTRSEKDTDALIDALRAVRPSAGQRRRTATHLAAAGVAVGAGGAGLVHSAGAMAANSAGGPSAAAGAGAAVGAGTAGGAGAATGVAKASLLAKLAALPLSTKAAGSAAVLLATTATLSMEPQGPREQHETEQVAAGAEHDRGQDRSPTAAPASPPTSPASDSTPPPPEQPGRAAFDNPAEGPAGRASSPIGDPAGAPRIAVPGRATQGIPRGAATLRRRSTRTSPSFSAPASDLSEEAALLEQALRALHLGQRDRARALLDAHARSFPHGALTRERQKTLLNLNTNQQRSNNIPQREGD